MSLLWPGFLLFLAIIPLIFAVYLWMLRRRVRFAVRYSSLALVRAALPQSSRIRRHLPLALFLLALTSLILALSRPVTTVNLPVGRTTIILAIDVSLSMCSTDIPPNRLQAAESAALSFIRNQNSNTQIGIVAFAGFAELIQPPTSDQEVLEDAITNLIPARRTAIGSGILRSLDAIADVDGAVAPSEPNPFEIDDVTPVPEGPYVPHIIVLLTDGASNVGPVPLDAGEQAARRGVRVYTIGFGTETGGPFAHCNIQFRDENFFGGGGGFGFGGGFRRGIDEDTLIRVADMTGGQYYSARSANELETVFRDLPVTFITKPETLEISVLFTAVGAFLSTIAILLSQRWNPLP